MAGSGYDFYLGGCLLPITPEKLEVSIKNSNKTMTLINEGQVNILKNPGLTEVEFSFVIPQMQYPFATYKSGFQGAAYYLNHLERLKISKAPFQFIVARSTPAGGALYNTNLKVAMEDYRVEESAGEGLDITVKVRLKQFRYYGTKSVTLKGGAAPVATVSNKRAAENSPAPISAQSHVFKEGESLWSIAKKYYGDGEKWDTIRQANKGLISGGPVTVNPGTVLTIPAI